MTPAEAPLDMPRQSVTAPRACARVDAARTCGWRRAVLIAFTLAAGAFDLWGVADVLSADGLTAAELVTAALSAVLTAWVAFSFVSALAGFTLAWRGARGLDGPLPRLTSRTAILAPVYNEDPARLLAAIQAMGEALRAHGAAHAFDVFVLSDTRDTAIAQAEAAGVLRLRLRLQGGVPVYYRRRADNAERKAGNIADWVRRWGGAYESMLVLDADSVMSGEAIIRLAGAMERDPRLGLLQTVPALANAETPFARLQQFAASLYGPMFALGQHWWSGDEGNFWGHNAIMRTRAFAASAGLPTLPGRAPFGGHIQSHDFVEAALLRRDGWRVTMWPELPGSYEECPPTLIDMAIRDRRWCQGNLQHLRLLSASGLHWVSRLHLLRGALSYLTAPLWLALLVCGGLVWPALETDAHGQLRLSGLFALTVTMLMAPKGLALLATLRDRRLVASFGGAWRLVASAAVETAVSLVVAPVLMMMQVTSVIEVLLGRDSGWGSQSRDEGDTTPAQAWRAHGGHVLLGAAGAVGASLLDPHLFLWTSPVFAGLVLSSLLSIHTARVDLGQRLARWGLLATPAELTPHPVLARTQSLRADLRDGAHRRKALDGLFRASVPFYRLAPVQATWRTSEPTELEAA